MNEIQVLEVEDFAAALRYLDAELEEPASLRFEVRLADDLPFAAAFERVAALDAAQRGLARDVARHARPSWWRDRRLGAAAAAALVVASAFVVVRRPAAGIDAGVAAIPTDALGDDCWNRRSMKTRLLPGQSRGGAGSEPDAAAVVEYAAGVEQALVTAALSAGDRDVLTGWFQVALRPGRECSAVVVSIDSHGRVEPRYPDPARTDFVPNRFEAEREYVLPRPCWMLLDGEPHYQGGFVCRGSEKSLTVLLALRAEAVEPALLDEFERWATDLTAAGSGDPETAEERRAAVAAWLAARGFSVHEVSVRVP